MKVQYECTDWVSLAKDSVSLLSFMNTVMNFEVNSVKYTDMNIWLNDGVY